MAAISHEVDLNLNFQKNSYEQVSFSSWRFPNFTANFKSPQGKLLSTGLN